MKKKLNSGIIIIMVIIMSVMAAAADVSNPTVTGPIPVSVPLGDASHDYPQMATQLDLAAYSYVEEEFFMQGTATRYDAPRRPIAVPPATAPAAELSSHPYKTRMIVRRPVAQKDFNGIVIVEWLNVTSGYNRMPYG
ncbi:MAG: hypothetical protein C4519_16950 [Desulfobacteraceae bacterium]|nr:MAG: hypothetical protein C4519_16950 [Desulfobacteraceae bacterium]